MKFNFFVIFFLITFSFKCSAQPFLSSDIESTDTIAKILNKYRAAELEFFAKIDQLKANGINLDDALIKIAEQNPDLSGPEKFQKFQDTHNIVFPPHLNQTLGYTWLLSIIQSLSRDDPKQFEKYKKYLAIICSILQKEASYKGPFTIDTSEFGLQFGFEIDEELACSMKLLHDGNAILSIDNNFKINRPLSDFKGSRLVLGCSHGSSSCQAHKHKARYDDDYTINLFDDFDHPDFGIEIDNNMTDIISDIYNPKLWETIPDNSFESVIFEGCPGISSLWLLPEIFRVLKPGGYIGNQPHIEGATIDDSVDNLQLFNYLVEQPLRNVTFRQLFTSIGFERIGAQKEDKVETIGFHAFKPVAAPPQSH